MIGFLLWIPFVIVRVSIAVTIATLIKEIFHWMASSSESFRPLSSWWDTVADRKMWYGRGS